jgi:hypothetical protein
MLLFGNISVTLLRLFALLNIIDLTQVTDESYVVLCFVFSELRSEVIVCFVDIGGIV